MNKLIGKLLLLVKNYPDMLVGNFGQVKVINVMHVKWFEVTLGVNVNPIIKVITFHASI